MLPAGEWPAPCRARFLYAQAPSESSHGGAPTTLVAGGLKRKEHRSVMTCHRARDVQGADWGLAVLPAGSDQPNWVDTYPPFPLAEG